MVSPCEQGVKMQPQFAVIYREDILAEQESIRVIRKRIVT